MKISNRIVLICLGAAALAAPAFKALADGEVRDHRRAPMPTIGYPVVRDHRAMPQPPGHRAPMPHIGRPIYVAPPRSYEPVENDSAQIVSETLGIRSCDQAGEALRELSNRILSDNSQVVVRDHRGGDRDHWRNNYRDPEFWKRVWARIAEAYRSCNRTCFDDGIAIGQISATAYCSASIALGGLNATGFTEQLPLPLCDNSRFVGCQQGYHQTAATVPGCSTYAQGSFERIFNEYQSEDCHID